MNLTKKIQNMSSKRYILLIIIIQLSGLLISYLNLFEYERCTELLSRNINLFDYSFELIYPKMCDEPYFFHGFQWFYSIYEYGYVYQDRPFYLLIGFIIYRLFYFLFYVLQFSIDPVSLLLLTSLFIQLFVLNSITYLINLIINKKIDRVYFIFYFLILLFSFEQRRYLFLPSNSTVYFLIFVFSIYSIQNRKLNGFLFGLLFTTSGYGVIGFIYLLLLEVVNRKNKFKNICLNIFLFLLPSFFFELVRISLGYLRGPQGGVRYIYAAEAYQQFIWFFKSLFKNYVPLNRCQTLNNFFNCYFDQTIEFFNIMKNYYVVLVLLFLATLILKQNENIKLQTELLTFTLFSYIFISFQGYYGFRIVYYSLGFSLFLFMCIHIFNMQDLLISFLVVALIGLYTLSRNSLIDFSKFLDFTNLESLLFVLIIFLIGKKLYLKKSI